MNQFKISFQDFQQCLKISPLPIISLLLYMGLKSTTILPGGLHEVNGAYHPAYLGWYDFVLGYAIIFSFITGSPKLKLKDFFLGLVILFIISASWVNSYQADKMFIVAGLVCFLRFFLVFTFAKALVRQLGYQTAESVLLFVYAIIAVSAILWYSLQFGTVQNRMAASAMTSASFGQVSGIICLVFYAKKHYLALFFSFIFLFLSFSRTSLLLFLMLIIIQNRRLIPLNLVKYVLVFLLLGIVGITILQKYGGKETQVVLKSRFSTEEVSQLNGRNEIWAKAIEQFKEGEVPLTGVGFHMTPTLIQNNNLKLYKSEDAGGYSPLPHFHSILVEYSLSLGIFAFVIFFYLIKRIWQTFQHNCSPAFFIFAFFLLSQVIDYTFYPPKEIIIFALMLGLADGQLSSTLAKIKSIDTKSANPEKSLYLKLRH
ncbi:MAG: O-Antigen ligase [Cyanobacteriota bacterium]